MILRAALLATAALLLGTGAAGAMPATEKGYVPTPPKNCKWEPCVKKERPVRYEGIREQMLRMQQYSAEPNAKLYELQAELAKLKIQQQASADAMKEMEKVMRRLADLAKAG